MSVSVVRRPTWMIPDTGRSFSITNSSGDALVSFPGHGKSTGDLIYIDSAVSGYTGYFIVSIVDPNSFKFYVDDPADFVAYTVTATGTFYYPLFEHKWNCVHLPIVFKLKSTNWPINGVDTARTITTFTNSNGYTYITCSGDIKATGVAASLEKVVIDGTPALDGVYTILQWYSDSNFVIDLAYSAGNVLSGGTVQYYYYNYHVRVKVTAGLTTGHVWDDLKPFTEIATLKCIPNPSGIITVNISEQLKKAIDSISNNTDQASLGDPTFNIAPINLDFFTQAYISFAESYDDSNGYTVEEFVDSYTDDNTNGTINILNAKEPFKTTHLLSRFLDGGTAASRRAFITNFDEPTLTPGNFFDVHFLNDTSKSPVQYFKRSMYVNDVLVDEDVTSIGPTASTGLYRWPVEQSGFNEDRIDVTLLDSSLSAVSETLTINCDNACYVNSLYLTWLIYPGGFDYWNFTAKKTYSVNVEDSKTQEKNIYTNWPNSYASPADTIRKQTSRSSRTVIRVESQHLTQDQVDAISWIISSPLVQIVTSRYDRRTVLVDGSSLRKYQDQDKLFNVGFTISYTDELPAQSL